MTPEEIDVAALLKLNRFAEHTTDRNDVSLLPCGGRQRFTDIGKHPNKAITAWGRPSTAAGACQPLYPSWKEAEDKGKGKDVVLDFSKASQDKLASRHAPACIQKGDIKNAIALLRHEWTSLPGAAQSDMSMDKALQLVTGYVAELGKP